MTEPRAYNLAGERLYGEGEFLQRLNGGPMAGDSFVTGPWPLPDRLEVPGGSYRKIGQSQVSDEAAAQMTHVMRGAEYEWVPA